MKKICILNEQKRNFCDSAQRWAFIIFMFSSQPYKQQDLAPILSRLLKGEHHSEYWINCIYV